MATRKSALSGPEPAIENGLVRFFHDTSKHKAAEEELRRSEERHRFLSDFAAATQSLADPDDVMAAAARLLAVHMRVDRCAYAEVEAESVFVITGDHTRGVPSIVGRWPVAAFGQEVVRLMLADEPFVMNDAETDPRAGDDLAAYRAADIRAVICVPLHKDGKFTAAMAVHQATPRVWTPEEIELTTTVVARCWEALERARVTRSLRESEQRYRAIVEATPECVKLVGPDGTLLQMNRAGLAMVEGDENSLGKCVYSVIAPEYRKLFRDFNGRVCSGEGGTLEFDIIGLRGTRRHMETTAVPLVGAGGGFTHLAVTRDVTERTVAARALADNRARLDYAVRLSGVGFWYCDLPFDRLQWDDRVKEHFWLPADAQVTIDTFYGRMHPRDREGTRAAIEAAIANRTPYDVDYRTVDPASGDVKWIRALGGTTYAADGSPTRFDGVTVDVTAYNLAEQTLLESDRRKDEFLALLAHELRNPLAPIRNGLQVLRLAGDDAAAVTQTREMMERQLSHMVRLIDDLLDISRINRNKMELRRKRLTLGEVVHAAIETARPSIDAAGHRFRVTLPAEPIYIDGDLTRLSQVFANLLTNSAKYTPPAGSIHLDAVVEGELVTIAVRDDGIGIPAASLPTIFDMFSQVDRSIERTTGGLGIGLALVKGLVEMHGGSVEAASGGDGNGSEFTVRLPVSRDASYGAIAASPEPVLHSVSRRRVLVVDDNRDAAATMAMMLKMMGNDVAQAHDGFEAIEAAERFRPNAILMDIGMPRLNGYDATRRIRSLPWGRQVSIIALTGWGQEVDRADSRDAGCDHHLVKPAPLDELKRLLESVGAD